MAEAVVEKQGRKAPELDTSKQISSLASYYALGRTGLKVSPLSLGTATFGQAWGTNWSSDKKTAREIVGRYFEAGGNFLDTADTYHDGESEEITGELVRELTDRDKVVIATKFTFSMRPGDPNGGGNGRKHIIEAVNASLKRLGTDYIDLYWMHNWDKVTPAEELMGTLNTLVQSGKVRYIGLSNPPAWYLGRAQTIAELRGFEKLAGIQMEYSLAARSIEHEYVDAAIELGLGICPWSPLANGLLSGKYKWDASSNSFKGDGRITNAWTTDPAVELDKERLAGLLTVLVDVARELGKSPAQVALNWVTKRPGVVSSIIGASKLNQLEDNIHALEFDIPGELLVKLEEASALPVQYPYFFHEGDLNKNVNSQTNVRRQPSWYPKR